MQLKIFISEFHYFFCIGKYFSKNNFRFKLVCVRIFSVRIKSLQVKKHIILLSLENPHVNLTGLNDPLKCDNF